MPETKRYVSKVFEYNESRIFLACVISLPPNDTLQLVLSAMWSLCPVLLDFIVQII